MTPLQGITMCLIAILPIAGCESLSQDQRSVIERARSINRYPVSRSAFVKKLGLSKIESDRISGGLRAGTITFVETWRHPARLTVSAYDSEYFGIKPIARQTDRDFTAQTTGITLNGLPELPQKPQPRQSFEQVIITTQSGRELFRSTRNKSAPASNKASHRMTNYDH